MSQVVGKPSFYNVQMKIRILNVSSSDLGKWQCMAKNPHGETSGEISLYGKAHVQRHIRCAQAATAHGTFYYAAPL